MPTLSKEYLDAVEAHNVISRHYQEVAEDYRAGKISDEMYLTARAMKVAADKLYDLAWNAEADRADETEPEIDPQLDMFS